MAVSTSVFHCGSAGIFLQLLLYGLFQEFWFLFFFLLKSCSDSAPLSVHMEKTCHKISI